MVKPAALHQERDVTLLAALTVDDDKMEGLTVIIL
jgi:hypothetical protein